MIGSKLAHMKRGPVGVWCSVALVILGSSLWVGSKLGSKSAAYWYRHKQQEQAELRGAEFIHAQAVLSELSAAQMLQVLAAVPQNDVKVKKKCLVEEIRGLEALKEKSPAQDIGPAIDYDLGLAEVQMAMAEEQENNKTRATQYMESAQSRFQSLGWQDHSQETLKRVASHELAKWSTTAPAKDHEK